MTVLRLFVVVLAACAAMASPLVAPQAEAASARAKSMMRQLARPPSPGLQDRRFTLETIKRRRSLRRHLYGVDIDTIEFRTNSELVDPGERHKLADIAWAIHAILSRRPWEVFLIEGHTDAVGTKAHNMTLSQRRAFAVRFALVHHFATPPHALTAVGYGENHLKIPIKRAERRNRRVTVRRITDILLRAPRPRPRRP